MHLLALTSKFPWSTFLVRYSHWDFEIYLLLPKGRLECVYFTTPKRNEAESRAVHAGRKCTRRTSQRYRLMWRHCPRIRQQHIQAHELICDCKIQRGEIPRSRVPPLNHRSGFSFLLSSAFCFPLSTFRLNEAAAFIATGAIDWKLEVESLRFEYLLLFTFYF